MTSLLYPQLLFFLELSDLLDDWCIPQPEPATRDDRMVMEARS